MKWYYVEGNKSFGPLEEAHLHVLVKGGQLRRGTLVYSETLSGWMPYEQAFGQQISAAPGAPPPPPAPPSPPPTPPNPPATPTNVSVLPAMPANNLPAKRLPGGGIRQEAVTGFAVGAGVVLVLAVLLTIHGMQTWSGVRSHYRANSATFQSIDQATVEQPRDSTVFRHQGDLPAGVPKSGASTPYGSMPDAQSIPRGDQQGTEPPDAAEAQRVVLAAEAAFRRRYGLDAGSPTTGTPTPANPAARVRTPSSAPATRSSILGQGLQKDTIERMLAGKRREEIRTLLGLPDQYTSGAMGWRYTNGVQIYDPTLDTTFLSVEVTFERSMRTVGTRRQLDYTVSRVTLLSVPAPYRGRLRN